MQETGSRIPFLWKIVSCKNQFQNGTQYSDWSHVEMHLDVCKTKLEARELTGVSA